MEVLGFEVNGKQIIFLFKHSSTFLVQSCLLGHGNCAASLWKPPYVLTRSVFIK